MSVEIYEKSFEPFGKVLAMENGSMELWVSLDFGPRIMHLALPGGKNLFYNDVDKTQINQGAPYDKYYGKGSYWRNYGGHRVWLTPEAEPRTYYPDNAPVGYQVEGNTVVFIGPEQKENGIQLTLTVEMEENDAVATITSTATNTAPVPQTFGLWNITVMCGGGLALMPQNTTDTVLLHNRSISLWPYADMSDARVHWGKNLIALQQDQTDRPFKLGSGVERGWLAYLAHDALFVKRFPYFAGVTYPDNGCNAEMYTNKYILELESLASVQTVEPQNTLTSTEVWSLTPEVTAPAADDMAALEQLTASLIEE